MCCSNHTNKNDNIKHGIVGNNKNHNTHMILMATLCLLPLTIAILISRLKLGSYITLGYLPYALFLLCPLGNFLMPVFMKDNNKEHKKVIKF
jgi:hypothetical protein